MVIISWRRCRTPLSVDTEACKSYHGGVVSLWLDRQPRRASGFPSGPAAGHGGFNSHRGRRPVNPNPREGNADGTPEIGRQKAMYRCFPMASV